MSQQSKHLIWTWFKSVYIIPSFSSNQNIHEWRLQLVNVTITSIILVFYPITLVITLPGFIRGGRYFLVLIDFLFLGLSIVHLLTKGRTILRNPVMVRFQDMGNGNVSRHG